MTVEAHDTDRVVRRTADVDAPAAEIFAIVADPHRHGELDGSGTVLSTVKGPERLAEGDRFSVNMKQYGVPYRITSRVTALVPDRIVEWRHPAGHRWRWELVAMDGGRTRVTESWDASRVPGIQYALYALTGQPAKNAAGITATLEQLQARYAG